MPTRSCLAFVFMLLSSAVQAASGADFQRLVDDFIFGTLALAPASATQTGAHRYHGMSLDDALDDYSKAGIEARRALLNRIEVRIDALPGSLDDEQRADVGIMRDAIGASRLDLDEIQSYRHNPTLYVELVGDSLYTHYTLHYAPAPERFAHIIARLKQLPRLLQQAQNNLVDSPDVWNQAARDENAGNIDLIDGELRHACPPQLKAAYDAAAAPALISLHAFSGWLEQSLSQHTADWRLGEALYAKKFRYMLAVGKTPQQLLTEAEADLVATRDDLAKLAAPQTVEQALATVADHHASASAYMQEASQDLASATAFVREKGLVGVPTGNNLQVVETPPFMRSSYSVGGFNPAPPLQPALGAFYWVTPVPASWPQARIDSKLREYNQSGLQHLTVHEAMPGHYLQAEYANRIEPRARRLLRAIYGNTPYVEGWAVYTQQLMADEGYQRDTPGYRLTLDKQLLRVLANTILDIRLQTQGMTDEQAIELMTKQTYQETEEANGKLQRAKLTSCQLPSYYAGIKGWLAARDHYLTRFPDRTPRQFREAALNEGAVPLPLLDSLLK
jgi:uncharacterized protein (DUF885 family)